MSMDDLDRLILRILDDIALCGSKDVEKYVTSFYSKTSEASAKFTSVRRAQHVDVKFQTQVWVWLSRHSEAIISSACAPHASKGSLPFGQCTCDPSDVDAPPASSQAAPARALRKCLRVSTSEERVWQAVAGHGPDSAKIPPMDFVCLVAIASRREEGILQPDLVKLTGQDKRSLPVRTTRLAERGYILKESVSARIRTSHLLLKRFGSKPKDDQIVRQTQKRTGVRMIFEQGYWSGAETASSRLEPLAKGVVQILEEARGLSYAKLRSKLDDIRLGSSQSLLLAVINILEHMGHVQQIKPPGAPPGQDGLPVRRINLTYPLMSEDWQDFTDFAAQYPSRFSQGTIDLEREEEYRYVPKDSPEIDGATQSIDRPAADGGVGEAAAASRPAPLWRPKQPLVNLIYQVTGQSSVSGLSQMNIQRRAVGRFFKRPIEHTITRLVDFWQVSQPPHLRHLAVVRDAAQVGRTGLFMHYTHGNFAARAQDGEASWEYVRTMQIAEPPPSMDSNGFPTLPDTFFVESENGVDLGSCQRDALQTQARAPKARSTVAARAKAKVRAKPLKTLQKTYDEQLLAISRPQTGVWLGQRTRLRRDYLRGRAPLSQLIVFKSPRLKEMSFPGIELRTENLSAGSPPTEHDSTTPQSRRTKHTGSSRDVEGAPEVEVSSLATGETSSPSLHPQTPPPDSSPRPNAAPEDDTPNVAGAPATSADTPRRTTRYTGPRKRRGSNASTAPTPKRARKSSNRTNAVDLNVPNDETEAQPANAPIAPAKGGKRLPSASSGAQLANGHLRRRVFSASPSPAANALELLKTFQAQPTPLGLASSESPDGGRENSTHDNASDFPQEPSTPVDSTMIGALDHVLPPEPAITRREEPTESLFATHEQATSGKPDQIVSDPTREPQDKLDTPTTPNKPRLRKVAQFGGSIQAARRKLFLDIIRDCNGVFPGDREIWYPFASRWMQNPQNARPDQRTVRQIRKSLIDNGKLRQVIFAFPNRFGASITKSILTLPDVAPTDPRVENLKQCIIDGDPDYHLPAGVGEIRSELRPRTLANKVEKLRSYWRALYQDSQSEDDEPSHGSQVGTAVLDFSPSKPKQPSQPKQTGGPAKAIRSVEPPELREPATPAETVRSIKPARAPRRFKAFRPFAPGEFGESDKPNTPRPCPHMETPSTHSASSRIRFMPPLGIENNPYRDFEETPEPCAKGDCESRYLDQSLSKMHPPGVGKVLMEKDAPLTPRRRACRVKGALKTSGLGRSRKPAQDLESVSSPQPPNGYTSPPYPGSSAHADPSGNPESLLGGLGTTIVTPGASRLGQQRTIGYPSAIISQRLASISNPPSGASGTLYPRDRSIAQAHRVTPSGHIAAIAPSTKPNGLVRPAREPVVEEPQPNGEDMVPFFSKRKLVLPGSRAARLESLLSRPSAPKKGRELRVTPAKRNRIRGPLDARFQGHEGDVRIAVAIIIVRTVAGGIERLINWELVARILEIAPNRDFLYSRWARIRSSSRPLIDKQTREFQDLFLQRYRSGDLPILDYSKVEEYDWESLYAWTMEQLCFPQASQPILPVDRKTLERNYTLKHDSRSAVAEVFEIKQAISVPRRHAMVHLKPSALSLPIRTAKKPSEERLEVARNYIRTIVMTPEAAYDPQVARAKLALLDPIKIDGPLQSMVNSRIIAAEATGRGVFGRGYCISEHFLARFVTNLEPPDFIDAAAFTNACREQFASDAPSHFDPFASNGVALAVIDMAAAGHTKLHQREVPLKKFGLSKGEYHTKYMDVSMFHFQVDIGPSETFPKGKPLASLPPLPQGPVAAGKDSALPHYPLWIDINGNALPLIWRLVLAAVVNILVARPGTTVENLVEGLGPGIEAFELRLVLAWLAEAKAAVWLGDDQQAARLVEWWWMVFEADEPAATPEETGV